MKETCTYLRVDTKTIRAKSIYGAGVIERSKGSRLPLTAGMLCAFLGVLAPACNHASRIPVARSSDESHESKQRTEVESAAKQKLAEADQFLAARNFNEAIMAYNEVAIMGDATGYRPTAVYGAAVSLWKAGERFDAELVLRKLISDYPSTQEAARAREALPEVEIVVTEGRSPKPSIVLGPVESVPISIVAAAREVRPRDLVRANLKLKAANLYPWTVDAVTGVTYTTDGIGNIVGKGTAVRFSLGPEKEKRLAALKRRYDSGLLTNAEYRQEAKSVIEER